ncbi:MAG: DUF2273 domain-containing protein [Bacillota bacterium]
MASYELWAKIKEYIDTNSGKVLGMLIGLLIGVLLLILGFWPTLLLVLCTTVGYFWGLFRDEDISLKKLLDKISPPGIR